MIDIYPAEDLFYLLKCVSKTNAVVFGPVVWSIILNEIPSKYAVDGVLDLNIIFKGSKSQIEANIDEFKRNISDESRIFTVKNIQIRVHIHTKIPDTVDINQVCMKCFSTPIIGKINASFSNYLKGSINLYKRIECRRYCSETVTSLYDFERVYNIPFLLDLINKCASKLRIEHNPKKLSYNLSKDYKLNERLYYLMLKYEYQFPKCKVDRLVYEDLHLSFTFTHNTKNDVIECVTLPSVCDDID